MTKIAALTDHDFTPASRFRIRQHSERLAERGIQVTDFPRAFSSEKAAQFFPGKRISRHLGKAGVALGLEALNVAQTLKRIYDSRAFEARWISREIVIGYPTFERAIPSPFFYDIDDAVFLNRLTTRSVVRLAKNAAAILAGNEYLADYCRQFNGNVHVIPTAVDTDRYTPGARDHGGEFVVGWSGTSSSFPYFVPLQGALCRFFREHPRAILKICSDRFPEELTELREHVHFEPWSSAAEVDQIRSFDVGLMPLAKTEWTKGKCSYKFLLYAACGVPTICTSFGMNSEVLNMGRVGIGVDSPLEWRDALEFCFTNRDSLAELFPDCRSVATQHFSAQHVADLITTAMKSGLPAATV